jgi:tRNA (guanine37-N1)-methyltransferase
VQERESSVPVYVVLLHYPIVSRKGALVTPISDQHELVGRILSHWGTEKSKQYHPDRVEAVSLISMMKDFEEVKNRVKTLHPESEGWQTPEVVMTDASPLPKSVSYSEYRKELSDPKRSKRPMILVFGISDTFYPEVHRILAPVYGPEGHGGYNHLSVRSAVAIILDRLFGL